MTDLLVVFRYIPTRQEFDLFKEVTGSSIRSALIDKCLLPVVIGVCLEKGEVRRACTQRSTDNVKRKGYKDAVDYMKAQYPHAIVLEMDEEKAEEQRMIYAT